MIIARLGLELLTPLHCGGDADGRLDQPVSRDAFGLWQIPGTSVAGVLRDYMREYAPDLEDVLFGCTATGERDRDGGVAAKVWCSAARLLDYDGKPADANAVSLPTGPSLVRQSGEYLRDHIRLDPETGTVADGAKFDEEIVPPGVRFAVELKLDGWERDFPRDSEESAAFVAMCGALGGTLIPCGGKRSSGYGLLRLIKDDREPWRGLSHLRFFDLTRADDLTAYLNLSAGVGFAPDDGGTELPWPETGPIAREPEDLYGAVLRLPLICRGPLLPGGASMLPEDDGVDMTCLTTPIVDYARQEIRYRRTLTGTAVRGVLRHQVHLAAQALGLAPPAPPATAGTGAAIDDPVTASIFGRIAGKGTDAAPGATLPDDLAALLPPPPDGGAAGHVACHDVYFPDDAPASRVPHVAVDPFTGGARPGALFDEKPLWSTGLEFEAVIRFAHLNALQTALLLHAILDLCTGAAPVGGGVNRGNGVLYLRGLGASSTAADVAQALAQVQKIFAEHGGQRVAPDNALQMMRGWAPDLDAAVAMARGAQA